MTLGAYKQDIPSVTTQPTNQTVVLSSNATFSVTASGTPPLAYQWLTNGTALSGATNSSLTVTNVTLAYQTNTFSVIITNNYGSVTSSVAVLTVLAPPAITNLPVSLTIAAGSTTNFLVTPTGSAPLAYQWLLNGAAIARATNSSLTITNANYASPGYYSVTVTNSLGSVTSNLLVLTVTGLPFTMPGGKGNIVYTNKQFRFLLSGPASSNAVISASTNLQNWIPLTTNPLTLGSLLFTDSLATNYSKRFYRATLAP